MSNGKKLLYLSSFPEEEWALNGHKRECVKSLLGIFESLAPYIKEGKYLELGCGTGILGKFLYSFHKKNLVPYGIDINQKAILLAKKNNHKFRENFKTMDYFKLNPGTFSDFATVIIFECTEKGFWSRLKNFLIKELKTNKNIYAIVFAYGYDLLNIKDDEIKQFVTEIGKLSNLRKINERFLIIEK